jgi:hypothetical protein
MTENATHGTHPSRTLGLIHRAMRNDSRQLMFALSVLPTGDMASAARMARSYGAVVHVLPERDLTTGLAG